MLTEDQKQLLKDLAEAWDDKETNEFEYEELLQKVIEEFNIDRGINIGQII